MRRFKSFEKVLSSVNENNFEDIALSLFQYQARNNKVYRDYLTYLGVKASRINQIKAIPFLPVSFFKDHKVVSGEWKPEDVFLSSSTTGMTPARHYVKDQQGYLRNTEDIFRKFYGKLSDYHFFALLPSYLERKGSSLVVMAKHFIEQSGSKYSAFYLDNKEELIDNLSKAIPGNRKVFLLGVSFALLDLAEECAIDLSNCVVMETGGMKGRREELTREAMHKILCTRFNLKSVHSEYGMTELFSQAYSAGRGYFRSPPGMKVLVRDINDPFEILKDGKTGGINVIDLANIHTCAFVETQDLGRVRQDGNFEILGRIDNSDIRGCNLMVG